MRYTVSSDRWICDVPGLPAAGSAQPPSRDHTGYAQSSAAAVLPEVQAPVRREYCCWPVSGRPEPIKLSREGVCRFRSFCLPGGDSPMAGRPELTRRSVWLGQVITQRAGESCGAASCGATGTSAANRRGSAVGLMLRPCTTSGPRRIIPSTPGVRGTCSACPVSSMTRCMIV